jgi:hypothetical protein
MVSEESGDERAVVKKTVERKDGSDESANDHQLRDFGWMDELNNPTFDCFKEDVVIELD